MRDKELILSDFHKLQSDYNGQVSPAAAMLNRVRNLRHEMKDYLKNQNDSPQEIKSAELVLEWYILKLFPIVHPHYPVGDNVRVISANEHSVFLEPINENFVRFQKMANKKDVSTADKKALVRYWEELKNLTEQVQDLADIKQRLNPDVNITNQTLEECKKKLIAVETWSVIKAEIAEPGIARRLPKDDRQVPFSPDELQSGMRALKPIPKNNDANQPASFVSNGTTNTAVNNSFGLPPLSLFDSLTPYQRAQHVLNKTPGGMKLHFELSATENQFAVTKISNNTFYSDLKTDDERIQHIKNLERMVLAYHTGRGPTEANNPIYISGKDEDSRAILISVCKLHGLSYECEQNTKEITDKKLVTLIQQSSVEEFNLHTDIFPRYKMNAAPVNSSIPPSIAPTVSNAMPDTAAPPTQIPRSLQQYAELPPEPNNEIPQPLSLDSAWIDQYEALLVGFKASDLRLSLLTLDKLPTELPVAIQNFQEKMTALYERIPANTQHHYQAFIDSLDECLNDWQAAASLMTTLEKSSPDLLTWERNPRTFHNWNKAILETHKEVKSDLQILNASSSLLAQRVAPQLENDWSHLVRACGFVSKIHVAELNLYNMRDIQDSMSVIKENRDKLFEFAESDLMPEQLRDTILNYVMVLENKLNYWQSVLDKQSIPEAPIINATMVTYESLPINANGAGTVYQPMRSPNAENTNFGRNEIGNQENVAMDQPVEEGSPYNKIPELEPDANYQRLEISNGEYAELELKAKEVDAPVHVPGFSFPYQPRPEQPLQDGAVEQVDEVIPRQYLELPDEVKSLIVENPNLESPRDSVVSNENDLVSNTLSSLEEQLREIQSQQYGVLPEGVVKQELNILETELDQRLADAELDWQQQNEIDGLGADYDDDDDESLRGTEPMEIDPPNIQGADNQNMEVENLNALQLNNLAPRTVKDQQEAAKAAILQHQEMGAEGVKLSNERRGYGMIPDEEATAKKADKPDGDIPENEAFNPKQNNIGFQGMMDARRQAFDPDEDSNDFGEWPDEIASMDVDSDQVNSVETGKKLESVARNRGVELADKLATLVDNLETQTPRSAQELASALKEWVGKNVGAQKVKNKYGDKNSSAENKTSDDVDGIPKLS